MVNHLNSLPSIISLFWSSNFFKRNIGLCHLENLKKTHDSLNREGCGERKGSWECYSQLWSSTSSCPWSFASSADPRWWGKCASLPVSWIFSVDWILICFSLNFLNLIYQKLHQPKRFCAIEVVRERFIIMYNSAE